MKLSFILIILLLVSGLPAQEQNSLDWDIDSIFDEPLDESPEEETEGDTEPSIKELIQQRGFYFDIGYEFTAGIAPGWHDIPSSSNKGKNDFYFDRFILMRGTFGLDIQISEDFRVKNIMYLEIPNVKSTSFPNFPYLGFTLHELFFDYKLYDVVFFRGGKYDLSWGISPNYGFTNLLFRIPDSDDYTGDSYLLKVDIPIGIGGIQALAMTRVDLIQNITHLSWKDFGYGGKYNLALKPVDLDLGIFYQDGMPLRSFLSIKTTLWKTELYNEYLLAVDVNNPSNISGALNIGVSRDIFKDKLNINGEFLYNAEKDSYWYHPETRIREAGRFSFLDGLGLAVNLLYKPWEKGNPRFFLRMFYAYDLQKHQHSSQLIPGFRLSPWPFLEFNLAVPMSLGSKDGYYYYNTFTVDNNAHPLPFAVIFLVTLKGDIQFKHTF